MLDDRVTSVEGPEGLVARSGIDVDSDQQGPETTGGERIPCSDEEATITTRRVEHPNWPARGRCPTVQHGSHHRVDQRRRGVPRASSRRRRGSTVGDATQLPRREGALRGSVAARDGADHDRGRSVPHLRSQRMGQLRAATPLTLREHDLDSSAASTISIDLDEVTAVYLPLTRLLNLYVAATQNLHKVLAAFLGTLAPKVPYVIGVAGSVAVGKSTFARILQALLARWPDHPQVDLVTTDGFLYPNRVLEERGIMNRKGFPESYDTRPLHRVPARAEERRCAGDRARLQPRRLRHRRRRRGRRAPARHRDRRGHEHPPGRRAARRRGEFVSDYFDFSIFIDADEAHIEEWYVERFMTLRETVFQDPNSFFRHYADLSDDEAIETARVHLARDQRQEPAREHRPDEGPARLLLRKGATTASPTSRCAACSGRSRGAVRPAGLEPQRPSQRGARRARRARRTARCRSTCSSSQSRWYGTCTAWPPSAITGRMSLRTLLPTIKKPRA